MPNIDKSHCECDRMRKAEMNAKLSSEVFLYKRLERIRGRSTLGNLKAEALAIFSDEDLPYFKPATTQIRLLILCTEQHPKDCLQ